MKKSILMLLLSSVCGFLVAQSPFVSFNQYRFTNEFHCLIQLRDGGFVASGGNDDWGGGTNGQHIMTRFDKGGNEMWYIMFGDSTHDENFTQVILGQDGFLYMLDNLWDSVSFYLGMTKIDMGGNIIWKRSYPFMAGNIEYDMLQSSDGTFYLAGSSINFDRVGLITKVSSDGEMIWAREYPGLWEIYNVAQSGNNLLLMGPKDEWTDPYTKVYKIDTSGTILDSTSMLLNVDFFHTNHEYYTDRGGLLFTAGRHLIDLDTTSLEVVNDIRMPYSFGFAFPSEDGGYYLLQDHGVVDISRMDSTGSIIWQKSHFLGTSAWIYDAIRTEDGGFAFAGLANDSLVPYAAFALVGVLDCEGNIIETAGACGVPYPPFSLSVFPNPAAGIFTISITGLKPGETILLSSYDSLGRRLWQGVRLWDGETPLDASELSPGCYHLLFHKEDGTLVHQAKLVVASR